MNEKMRVNKIYVPFSSWFIRGCWLCYLLIHLINYWDWINYTRMRGLIFLWRWFTVLQWWRSNLNNLYRLVLNRFFFEFFNLFKSVFLSTEWTILLFLQPLLQTIIMEVVATYCHSNHIDSCSEIFEAHGARFRIHCLIVKLFAWHIFID